MKKILYFIDYPLDLLGGAQLSTKTICDALTAESQEFSVKVVTPKLMHNDIEYDFGIIEYPNSRGGVFGLLYRLIHYRRIIKKEKPDIVHAQMPLSAVVLCILKGFGMIHNRFIFTDRALFNGYSPRIQKMFKLFAKQIDCVVCTTEVNKHLWERVQEKKRIKVIYNSVSAEFQQNINNIVRQENELLCIGFAGRVTDFKDWPLCLRICQSIKDRGVKFRVSCVMSAYTEEEKNEMQGYIQELREITAKENFDVSVDVGQSEMPSFYSKVDVFILTSKFESFGKTAIEAMSCGCSVIATNVGGLPEVIGKNDNLYTSEEYEKCVDLVVKYSFDRELLRSDQRWFTDRFNTIFDISNNITRHIQLYSYWG